MVGPDMHCCYREQLAFSLYSKFREPRLYRAAGHMEDWDSIPARCQSHPKEALFQHKFAPNDTALHRIFRVVPVPVCNEYECQIIRLDPVIEEQRLRAVQALLAANQQAAAIQDAFLRTPLHLACMELSTSGSSTSSIGTAAAATLILENDPGIACITDVEKRTPLHFLLARNDDIPMPFLQALIQHGPAAVRMVDAVGETPIDIVVRRTKEIAHAEIILEMLQNLSREERPAR
jgi:ankyrin repeat protein